MFRLDRLREMVNANALLEEERKRVRRLRRRLEATQQPDAIADAFHRLYYDLGARGKTWTDTRWMGAPVLKLPLDLWVYQELVYESRPTLVVETGTADGGSALFFASLFDLLGEGRVVTVDIAEHGPTGEPRPEHGRIRYLLGSSTDEGILGEVRREAEGERVLVVLDSDHSRDHVLAELRAYAPLASSHLIVEDTNVNGHPVLPEHGPGPMEAVEEFLPGSGFERDEGREKLLVTFNPKGFLRRKT